MSEHGPRWRAAGRTIDCIESVAQLTFTAIGGQQTSSGGAKSVLLVLTNTSDAARDAEFNRWYDDVHVPDVTSVEHFLSAQRYKLAGKPSKTEPDARYLAIYAIDTDDTRAAMQGLGEGMKRWTAAGRIIDCLQVVSGTTYAAIGARQQAKAGV